MYVAVKVHRAIVMLTSVTFINAISCSAASNGHDCVTSTSPDLKFAHAAWCAAASTRPVHGRTDAVLTKFGIDIDNDPTR